MQNLSHKRARDYYRRMLISDARELSDVYANCSVAKRKAYEYCLKLSKSTTVRTFELSDTIA